jgi:hypothetical protein
MLSTLDKHAPSRSVRRHKKHHPLFSVEIQELKQMVRKQERKHCKNPLTVSRQILNALRHRLATAVRSHQNTVFCQKISELDDCKQQGKLFELVTSLTTHKSPDVVLPEPYSNMNLQNSFAYFCV